MNLVRLILILTSTIRIRMIYRFLFLSILLATNTFSFGQFYKQSQADSLQLVLSQQKGKERIHTLLHLSDCYYFIQLDTAIAYANRAKEAAKENKFEWGKYKANYFIAKAQLCRIKISEVQKRIEECIDWFQVHSFKEDELYCELLLNKLLIQTKSFEVHQKHANRILNQAKKLGNTRLIGHAYFQFYMSLDSQVDINDKLAPLDSAVLYLNQVNDSAFLLDCQLFQI